MVKYLYKDLMKFILKNLFLLHIKYEQQNKLIATFSNEEHNVLVQEIMFEKHWNEVKSFDEVMTNRS